MGKENSETEGTKGNENEGFVRRVMMEIIAVLLWCCVQGNNEVLRREERYHACAGHVETSNQFKQMHINFFAG